LAFARHNFELTTPRDDGSTLLAHLQSASEAMGRMHPTLANGPSFPAGLETLWRNFGELHKCRGSSGFSVARITFVDIDAWQRTRRIRLNPWEIDLIQQVDDLWLSEFAPKPKAEDK
jgi:hypothetical protein